MSKVIKIMLLGDSSVGKSCLMYQYCNKSFVTSYISTVGIDFQVKELQINGDPVKVQVWDTAGQEQFHTINFSYYRGADGIALVYDVTNRASYANIHKWLRDIRQYASEKVNILILGNKLDLMEKRQVSLDEGQLLALDLGHDFGEASAKTAEGVDEAFLQLVQKIQSRKSEEELLNKTSNQPPQGVDLHKTGNHRLGMNTATIKNCCSTT